jgi:hypothetical protein
MLHRLKTPSHQSSPSSLTQQKKALSSKEVQMLTLIVNQGPLLNYVGGNGRTDPDLECRTTWCPFLKGPGGVAVLTLWREPCTRTSSTSITIPVVRPLPPESGVPTGVGVRIGGRRRRITSVQPRGLMRWVLTRGVRPHGNQQGGLEWTFQMPHLGVTFHSE